MPLDAKFILDIEANMEVLNRNKSSENLAGVILVLAHNVGLRTITATPKEGFVVVTDSKGLPVKPLRIGSKDNSIQVTMGEHIVMMSTSLPKSILMEIEDTDIPDTRTRKHKPRTYITNRKGMSYPKLGRW